MALYGRPKRLNIVDLKAGHPENFGRFVMALKHLANSDDWYRICGIHGATFKPGDPGVLCPTDLATVTKLGETGEPFYCKHSVYSFIAWHTPYIYQFELLLNRYNKSENKDYITLPYLDLTRGCSADGVADNFDFLNEEFITIYHNKKKVTVENPLAHAYFYYHGIKSKTYRCGFFNAKNPVEKAQVAVVKKQLNNALYAGSYEQFSSMPVVHSKSGTVSLYVPLETPHNQLHDIIGGQGGVMSDVSISAFDPVFWLHHCNMDRHYYTWMYNNTEGFDVGLVDMKGKMTKATAGLSCAPFSDKYVYASDPFGYNWGWKNDTLEFTKVGNVLDFRRFPYTYDLIVPGPFVPTTAFVELIDIPIPRESMRIKAYLHLRSEPLDRVRHFAGVAVWFGVNRQTTSCNRCAVTRTNIKIDISDYASECGLTRYNIEDYELILDGEGSLIAGAFGYKTYSLAELVGDGSFAVVVV
jgi:hypothetical protein